MGWGKGRYATRGNKLSACLQASLSTFRSALAFLSLVVRLLHFFLCTIRVDSWTIFSTMSYLGIPPTCLLAWCVFNVS
jgi:hypothetical protein